MSEQQPLMLRGTGGHKDYYLVAVNNIYGLGLKILGMYPGAGDGKPGTVGYAVRVRSCKIDLPELQAIYGESIPLEDPELMPYSAFSDDTDAWGKADAKRASKVITLHTSDDFTLSEEGKIVIPPGLSDGGIRGSITASIMALVPSGSKVILDEERISEQLEAYENFMYHQIEKALQNEAGLLADSAEDSVADHQNQLAAQIKKKVATVEEDPDIQPEDEDGDEDDED